MLSDVMPNVSCFEICDIGVDYQFSSDNCNRPISTFYNGKKREEEGGGERGRELH